MGTAQVPFFVSFRRSQLAALIATLVDFGTLVFCVEAFGIWAVLATAIGAAVGAVTNFLLGRHWSFGRGSSRVQHQALRYAMISGMSLVLNSAGVFFFTERGHLHYTVAKLMTAILVGIFFNFPLHRHFVFR